MRIRQSDNRANVYKIYYIVIAGMCLLILLLFNMLVCNRIQQYKEAAVNEIRTYTRSQTYNIDRGMESMLNNVYIQRGALEGLLSSEEADQSVAIADQLEYNKAYHTSFLNDKKINFSGNILVEGDIHKYTADQKKEINNLYHLFDIQNLLQKYTVFDIWSVYYSREGYLLIYPYASLNECIPEGQKFQIKELVAESIKEILSEKDPTILQHGWETDAFYDMTQQVLMFSKSLPVQKGGKITGIITCNMSVEDIKDFISQPPDLEMYIVDNSGKVIYDNGNFNSELIDSEIVFHDAYGISLDEYGQIINSKEKELRGLYFFSSKFKNTNWMLITVARNSILSYGRQDKILLYFLGNFAILAFAAALIIILRKYHKKVREIELMKSDFLMTVSHDLKSPMMLIMGHLRHIRESINAHAIHHEKKKPYREIEHRIAIIENEGARLKNLINNIIELSKLRFGEILLIKSRVNIREILEEVKGVIENEAVKKQVSIRMDIKSDNLYVYADREMLSRVIMNLASNALDASEHGEIVFRSKKDNETVYFEIEDTGCGMTAEEQAGIFSSFTTNKKQGTGLGLSIAKGIVEKHGGNIGCTSEKGKGSIFYFSLPIE